MNIPQLVERKFLFAPDQPIQVPLYEIVIAQNGVFKRARRREMTASVELSAFAVKIPELAIGEAFVKLAEKIPAKLFKEILAHARTTTDVGEFTENLYAICRDAEIGGYYWKEISLYRCFGSTVARDDDPAYQNAILEIHTHPPNCHGFSSQDDRDESGKFRLFGILVDIHSEQPLIRLRVGIYDSFWEIPVEAVTDDLPENLTDLVKQEKERLAKARQNFGDEMGGIFSDGYNCAANLSNLENL